MAVIGPVESYRRAFVTASDMQRCGSATFAVRQPSSTRVAVAVIGEVDALNSRALGRYVQSHTRLSKQLVLDLRAVDFFGNQGFTALYYINVHCVRRDVDWMIVASPAVRRLVSICDPDGELPMVYDLPTALARLDHLVACHYHVAPAG